MSAPRHLWSGDWRRESAESARTISELRDPDEALAAPSASERPPASASAAAVLRSVLRQAATGLRGAAAVLRRTRAPKIRPAVVLVVAMLLSAGAAYAVVASLRSHDRQGPPLRNSAVAQPSSQVRGGPGWLGVDTTSFAPTDGAMIVSVAPGGPADRAGLEPGDVITQLDNQPVQGPADLESVLSGLQAGQRVQLDFQRGPSTYATQATLQARPAGP